MSGKFIKVFVSLVLIIFFNFNFCDGMKSSSNVKKYSIETDKQNLCIDFTHVKNDDIGSVLSQFFDPKVYLYKNPNMQDKNKRLISC